MAQYKIEGEVLWQMRNMASKADGVCFINTKLPSSIDNHKLLVGYYKFGIEGSATNRLIPLDFNGRKHIDWDNFNDVDLSEIINFGAKVKFKVDDVDVYVYKCHEINSVSNSPNVINPPDHAKKFGLVYFNLMDLINVADDRDHFYITENTRKFCNLEQRINKDGNLEYSNETEFVTLIATQDRTFGANFNHLQALRYADGKPCPPFWSPSLYIMNPLKDIIFRSWLTYAISGT